MNYYPPVDIINGNPLLFPGSTNGRFSISILVSFRNSCRNSVYVVFVGGKIGFQPGWRLDSSWYIYSSELVGSSNIYNGRALLVFKTNDIKPAIVNIHKEPTMRFKNLVSINPSTDTPGIYPIVLGWFEIYLPILGNWCVGDNQQNHNLSLNGEAWWSIM